MFKTKKLWMRVLAIAFVIINISTTAFAAWWGTPGYEWCYAKGITPAMSQSELNQPVTNERFYDILLKYLRYKELYSHPKIERDFAGYTDGIDPIFAGMATRINKYLLEDYLTPQEYKQVISYADHAQSNITTHMSLIHRNQVKEFFLYLDLARYRAASLISHTADYRRTEMAKYSNVKSKDIFLYGMQPYFGKVTRKEFLVLMFTLLAKDEEVKKRSDEEIIELFWNSGVLLGYDWRDKVLELDARITYAELFTFLQRLEYFDFTLEEKSTN